jgi:TRAP-type uncharacterized transport system substrate-binding protein
MKLRTLFSRSTDTASPRRLPPSRRSARRKLMLISVAGVLALTGIGVSIYYYAMRPTTLRLAVGPANSDDARVVQTLTQAFLRDHSTVRLRPFSTEGAVQSAKALEDGRADLAIIRGDLDVPKNALAVATLRKNVAVLWVPTPPGTKKPVKAKAADDEEDEPKAKPAKAAKSAKGKAKVEPKPASGPAPITKISQLGGKRIGVIGRTQANVNLLKVILQQYAVDPTKVEIVQFSTNEIAEAVRGQKVDAFLAAGPVNSRITTDAVAASARDGGEPIFLAIDLAEALAQKSPVYEASTIPAGAFGGTPDRPDDEVKTISFSHHIVARRGIPDHVISTFTRQLFAVRQTLVSEFPLAAKIETPDTDKDAVLPVHPGAAAYVDGEEKTFLDRYSDYIWFSLMALSGVGSLGAWFASYLRRDERNSHTALRDRLLDMLGLARRSESADELDAMQADADIILRDALTCYEHGAIDEGGLTAFGMALEQFHNAVADRRVVLEEQPRDRPAVPSPSPGPAPVPLRANAGA